MQGSSRESDRICYADIKMRKFIALVMLHDCCQIFNQTSPVQRSDKGSSTSLNESHLSHQRAQADLPLDQKFLDDIFRTSLCFEIFFKAILLLRGHFIHKIDKIVNEELHAKQLEYPIKISEVSDDVFKNLGVNTIGWELLTTHGYKSHFYMSTNLFDSLYMPPNIFDRLEGVIEIHKNFQVLTSKKRVYSQIFIDDLLYIRMCYREFVVKLHNDLLEQHAGEQIGGINVQPELPGRRKPEAGLRRFYHRLAGKQR